MILLIDHKHASIKPDTTIDYISSNLLFSDREDFSLTFTLPLRGCKQNRDIFSNIYRKDVDITTLYYDAEIVAGRFRSSGAVAVVEVNDDDIKLQFISGRSFRNFYVDWDNTFVNELDLGSYTYDTSRTPATMWGDGDVIALPWVNNTSGNLQNRCEKVNGVWQWHTVKDDDEDTEVVHGLSCQLRLYTLVEKICEALDYDFIADDWLNDENWYNLFMLNTLPAAWSEPSWASALPHWSVNEFFEELEKLMACEFDINHKTKTVTFSFSYQNESSAGGVELQTIVDEFSVTIDKDDKSDYHGTENIGYENCDHELWPFYSCYWYFKKNPNARVKVYATLDGLITHLKNNGPNFGRSAGNPANDADLIYCEDVATYFALYCNRRIPTGQIVDGIELYSRGYELRPVNRFGDWITDEDNYTSKDDIKFVPAWLDLVETIDENDDRVVLGRTLFLACGSTDNVSASGRSEGAHMHGYDGDYDAASEEDRQAAQREVNQANLFATQRIVAGDNDGKQTTFDRVYVGFWYGEPSKFGNYLPAPWTDCFEFINDYDYVDSEHDGTLRINNAAYSIGPSRDAMTKIDKTKKYEFSFVSEELPNVRAKFLIRGKWYLCSEIQCEIDSEGLSKLMKGTFWRILEETEAETEEETETTPTE